MEGIFERARASEPSTDVAAVPLVLVEGPRCEGVLYRCCYSCCSYALTSLRVFVVEAAVSLLVFVWFLFLCFFLWLFRFLCVCSLASVLCLCCWRCYFCCC